MHDFPDDLRLPADFCRLPTAAFREDAVLAYVRRWADKHGFDVDTDAVGNLLLRIEGTSPSLPRLVLVAHTDHPAFVSRGDGTAEFRGGVRAGHAENARVHFFDGDTPGRVFDVQVVEADDTGRLRGVTLAGEGAFPAAGAVGMFEFDENLPRLDEAGVLHARACDDLAGCASALATLERLRADPPATTTCVLLTRAEEVGFVGAIAAASDRHGLLRPDDRLISIETSARQPAAVVGKGVVLRVGDATSIFHSGFAYHLFQTAKRLAGLGDFAFQRSLMPGGTCEGTVFDAFGFVTAAVCVPLGNYHNMHDDEPRTAAEYIAADDWRAMVRLFVETARTLHEFDGSHDALRRRLIERFEKNRHLFDDPTAALPA